MSTAATIEPTRSLVRSSAHILDHLLTCDACQHLGVRYCEKVDGLMAAVRADRRDVIHAG